MSLMSLMRDEAQAVGDTPSIEDVERALVQLWHQKELIEEGIKEFEALRKELKFISQFEEAIARAKQIEETGTW